MSWILLWLALAVGGVVGCQLPERSDFLIGRSCLSEDPQGCDEGQVCLPHGFVMGRPSDFRCRDAASFESGPEGQDRPIAYCLPDAGLNCPDGIVCGAGRILEDSGLRRLQCKSSRDSFGPPSSGADLGSVGDFGT